MSGSFLIIGFQPSQHDPDIKEGQNIHTKCNPAYSQFILSEIMINSGHFDHKRKTFTSDIMTTCCVSLSAVMAEFFRLNSHDDIKP